jgi:type III pantothenate kinase
MSRWLLIDNSNTRTKLALGGPDGLSGWRARHPTPGIDRDFLAKTLGGVEFDGALVASVVPETGKRLREFLESRGPVHFLGPESDLGLAIDYPEPAQIGADRLANAIGVVARHGAPAIVIDFGTAVTFDVISSEPAYLGGAIAPGLGAMSDYLARRTALLPRISLAEPEHAIGKSTEEAMQAGAVFGYRGLIRGILRRLFREIDGRPAVVATGGDAALIASEMPEVGCIDVDITLEGLRIAAMRNLS